MNLVGIVGEQREPDIVSFRHRPAKAASIDVPDLKILEVPPFPPRLDGHEQLSTSDVAFKKLNSIHFRVRRKKAMESSVQEDRQAIRQGVRELCKNFPSAYWRDVDKHEKYPQEFVNALTDSEYLAALIPEEYGGAGLGVTEAGIILEEINRSGGNPGACHAQMYTMGTLLRHGSDEQKRRYLPGIAKGDIRLQAFAVTEPNAGSETTRIETRAVRKGDRYIVNGQKIFISRAKQSDLMLLLARTTPYEELKDKTQGLSVFLVDMRNVKGMQIDPLDMMVNHHTNTIFLEDVEVPVENRIGEEGKGFRYIIDGWNVETNPRGFGSDWRRALVHRTRILLRARPRRLRTSHRRQPGNPVPDRSGIRPRRGRRPDAL